MVYVTGRDENRLYMIDGLSLAVVNSVQVGHRPWGVSINPNTNKVYVANFASADVWVLDGTSLAVLATIHVGPEPTFVKVNEITNTVYVVTHANDGLGIINGDTDALIGVAKVGGAGAWGLAINPNLNRLYVSTRDTGGVQVLDENAGHKIIDSIVPCGDTPASPYGLEFNPANNKLYIACSSRGNVNAAAIYRSTLGGLSKVVKTSIGNGGEDGGGGVAVNPANGHAFFTNSLANTASVLSQSTNEVFATVPVGTNPFGLAVDPGTGRVYVADRTSNDLYVFADPVEP
jgi:YVTN family beta-propeller protein